MQPFKTYRTWLPIIPFLALAVALAGCSGSSGSTGAQGAPGPAGPPGPPGPTTTGGTVTSLTLTITGASLGATSTVDFKAVDQNGNGYIGIPGSALEVTLAQLVPGTDGNTNHWQNYNSGPIGVGNDPSAIVAETDSGGSLFNNGDGTYEYTFGVDVTNDTSPVNVTFDPSLTHRIAIAIRSSTLPTANNAIYTWQPSTGKTTGIPTRSVVEIASCNECHDHLSAHGGPRKDTRMCVTCHNPGSSEVNTLGNVVQLDFRQMIHKIHRGEFLPSVQAGTPFIINGYRNSVNDFSDVVWPQDIRNCTKCHNPDNPDTPDAINYKDAPSMQACGACHDDVNFAQGQAGGHPGGVVTDNSQCTVCHAANRVAGSIPEEHTIISKVDAANYAYNILSITNTLPGQKPVVKFSITNPNNNDAPYNIQTDPAFTASGGNSRLAVDIAWSNVDYENIGSGNYPGQPVSINALNATPNGDGTYTVTSPVAIPMGTTGSGTVGMEGHPADTTVTPVVRIPVKSQVKYFAITDAQPVPRRRIVDTAKCQKCHGQNDGLSLHGNNRTDNTQLCVICHNPDDTDIGQRPNDPDQMANGVNTAAVDHLEQRQIDFKYMIHAIHSADFRSGDFIIYGFGGSVNNFADVGFPGILNDCSQCHITSPTRTYVPPLAATDLGTTIDTRTTRVNGAFFPTDTIMNPALYNRISPTASTCSACHSDSVATSHMQQNGASFGVPESVIGSTAASTETCELCHGTGGIEDVTVAHGVP